MATSDFRVDQIDHIELYVPDREAAAEWYRRVLGLRVIEEFRFWAEGGGPLMVTTAGAGTKIAFFEGPPQGEHPVRGLRCLAFRTSAEGFTAFCRSLKSLNLNDAQDGSQELAVVDHGKAISVYFQDPWGTALEVATYDHEPVREALAAQAV